MSTIMSTGQITLVDLTDQRTNSFYLQADQSKIQVYDVNKKTYSPDYTTSQGSITITPSFFFGNDDYSNKIEQADISYYINDSTVAATKISTSASSSEDCYQKGINLIIAQNIGKGTFTNSILKIRAVIFANSIVDEKTGLSNSSNIEATIEFAKVETGANGASGEDGISITNVQQQYLINKSSTTPPDKTDSGWSSSHGAWTEGSYLWIRTAITYSNGLVEYTDPYCDSSWKAAADGVSKLSERIDGVDELIEALQKEVDGAIETWYLEGDPSKKEQRPWYDSSLEVQDSDAEHEGDLYFDTITGKSYRFLKQGEVYIWQIITDTELSGALSDILQLQDDVKTKVTIYYGEQPTGNNIQINDMWVDSEGNFYQYIKKSDGVYEWSLASYSVSRVETEYAESSSNTTAPESGWSTNSPVPLAPLYLPSLPVTKGNTFDLQLGVSSSDIISTPTIFPSLLTPHITTMPGLLPLTVASNTYPPSAVYAAVIASGYSSVSSAFLKFLPSGRTIFKAAFAASCFASSIFGAVIIFTAPIRIATTRQMQRSTATGITFSLVKIFFIFMPFYLPEEDLQSIFQCKAQEYSL